MKKCYIDFETHYDSEYSLSKMPTMQYIRDQRFRVLGAAVCIPGELPACWRAGPALDDLIAQLPWHQLEVVAHNCAFDGAILTEVFGQYPARYGCTMLQARYHISQGALSPDQRTSLAVLAPLVGMAKQDNYAGIRASDSASAQAQGLGDLEICMALDAKYGNLPARELDLIDLCVRMAVEPVFGLDVDRLEGLLHDPQPGEPEYAAFLQHRELAEAFRSAETFAAVLRQFGVEPGYKDGAKGPIYAFAKSDEFMVELLESEDSELAALAELRLFGRSTQLRTRAASFKAVGSPLPFPNLYYAAHTGRNGGTDRLNLLNLKRGGELRKCLVAPPRFKLVVVDSAQIEARVNAYVSGCAPLLQMFRESDAAKTPEQRAALDVYRRFAAERMYNVPVADVTPAQRQIAKSAVLALGFGQGVPGFERYCKRNKVDITSEVAQYAVDVYRTSYPEIVGNWRKLMNKALSQGFLLLPSGRKLMYPGLARGEWVADADGKRRFDAGAGSDYSWERPLIFSKRSTRQRVNFWHGGVTENYVQAFARDVVMDQTLRLVRQGWHAALSVYDEAVLVVPEAETARAADCASAAFGSAPSWCERLPVKGDVKVCNNYGEK